MNKILITIIICLAVVALAAAGFYIYISRTTATEPAQSGDTGGSYPTVGNSVTTGSNTQQSSSSTTSQQQNGTGALTAKDFLHASDTYADPNNAGQYFLAGTGKNASSSPPYNILYVAADQSFTVALLSEPLASVREQAQAALQNSLGISQGDMCNLRYTVLVPQEVNPYYSGQNLGFSFCTGSVALQ